MIKFLKMVNILDLSDCVKNTGFIFIVYVFVYRDKFIRISTLYKKERFNDMDIDLKMYCKYILFLITLFFFFVKK